MKTLLKSFLFLGSFLLLQSPVFALGFEVGLGGNQIVPSGHLGFQGTSLDLKNDLNFGQINTFMARIKLETPLFLPNVYLIANPMKFEGTQVRTVPFSYGGNAYSANVPYNTTLKLDHYDLTLYYGVPGLKGATDDILNLDFGLNIRFIDFKGEIVQPQTGLSKSKSLAIPVPMGYLALQIEPIKLIQIEGELQAIAYGGNRYVDAIGRVKINPLPFLFVAGGYSFQNIAIDQSDVNTDMQFGGPVIEAGVRF